LSQYFAHTDGTSDTGGWQRLCDHLTQVGHLAEGFARQASMKDIAGIIGLLHDVGKYSVEFQNRLAGDKTRVDHSTAGAIEAERRYGLPLGRIIAYTVAGHHAGLPNGGSAADPASLAGRCGRQDLPDYSAFAEEISLPPQPDFRGILGCFAGKQEEIAFNLSFLTRMLYSCLVDADFLDTEEFMSSDKAAIRIGKQPSLRELLTKLDKYLSEKQTKAPDTPVNQERQKILAACRAAAEQPPGFFSLTVPTGGGKTLSSLAFGLIHALKHKLDRVIYVIPFTSIIEQNAAVFRDAVGEETVLEHHSNYDYPEESFDEWDEIKQRHRLAAENWDMPLIATTAVQFFESLFANRSSRCRKLHNIAGSVVILDEAQMLPTDYLKPVLSALTELVKHYRVTAVFCTATQPALSGLLPEGTAVREIIPEPKALYERFRRVTVEDAETLTDSELAAQLQTRGQVLCIVNTRRHARLIYGLLGEEEGNWHLSARMCPAHRTAVLADIKEALKAGRPCRVVSTQLIEAGVDVDFPVVYRAAAGLDSIVQAAGRCNREGRAERGRVLVFRPEKHGLPSGWFSRTASIADMTLRKYSGDPVSLLAIEDYFLNLYSFERERLDAKDILESLREGLPKLWFPFRDIAEKFKLIEQSMQPVIIPYDAAAEEMMRQAEIARYPGSLARKLQPYTVQVYPFEFAALAKNGIIRKAGEIYWFLSDTNYYDGQIGLLDARDLAAPAEVLIY